MGEGGSYIWLSDLCYMLALQHSRSWELICTPQHIAGACRGSLRPLRRPIPLGRGVYSLFWHGRIGLDVNKNRLWLLKTGSCCMRQIASSSHTITPNTATRNSLSPHPCVNVSGWLFVGEPGMYGDLDRYLSSRKLASIDIGLSPSCQSASPFFPHSLGTRS
jgi:hypothetical protein